jgi:hypothetical protein
MCGYTIWPITSKPDPGSIWLAWMGKLTEPRTLGTVGHRDGPRLFLILLGLCHVAASKSGVAAWRLATGNIGVSAFSIPEIPLVRYYLRRNCGRIVSLHPMSMATTRSSPTNQNLGGGRISGEPSIKPAACFSYAPDLVDPLGCRHVELFVYLVDGKREQRVLRPGSGADGGAGMTCQLSAGSASLCPPGYICAGAQFLQRRPEPLLGAAPRSQDCSLFRLLAGDGQDRLCPNDILLRPAGV